MENSDSEDAIKFMALFGQLRELVDRQAEEIVKAAKDDESIRKLCVDLSLAALTLSMQERHHRRLFVAPVSPHFLEMWREYEERYQAHILDVFLLDLDLDFGASDKRAPLIRAWELANEEGARKARALQSMVDFADDNASDDLRNLPNDYREEIWDGISAWRYLTNECGVGAADVLRRREITPIILIPRHVAKHHGESEKLSLYTYLQQAQDAFVFGLPIAAIALMRTLLEMVLRDHYEASGDDLDTMIDNCKSLPAKAPRQALHHLRCLANDLLHGKKNDLPKELEYSIISHLLVLRSLIEGAPTQRPR